MKQIYTTLFALIITATTFANSITAVKNGTWNDPATWDANQLPANGDSVIIPSNKTVTLDDNQQLDQVIIIVAGTLDFDNGKLKMDNANFNSQFCIFNSPRRSSSNGQSAALRTRRLGDHSLRAAPAYRDRLMIGQLSLKQRIEV